ncbi:uncharacterized protein ARMOST_15924 [Armillaria ostoyae]|uniref:Uncharacterized protein n=1 Tax=Armillaria ostoyae TaxID=47428 RepID=A0A284RUT7_ARMOS|nr:uncharacterized protein ARMOST_15924 [Armillaria ostoyae]
MSLTEHASGNTPLHPQDDSESVDSQEFDMALLFDFESLFEDHSLPISPDSGSPTLVPDLNALFVATGPSHATQTAKEYKRMRADKEQRKIEIFTLYIMGLKNRWVNGPPPENWTLSRVFAKLDELEDMITQRFKEVEHYFVEVEERWDPEDLHV